MKLGTSFEKWHKNGIFETRFMEDGTPAHLTVSTKQWHRQWQRHNVKGQTFLQLPQEEPRSQPDWISIVPIEAMTKARMSNMDGRTNKYRTEVRRKITLSYLQSQYESLLRRMRAFGKVKEAKTKCQYCYRHVNYTILSIKRPLIHNAINFFPR